MKPRFKRTPENWHKLVEAFREKPGNYTHAGKTAGCDLRCSRRAWNEGWPNKDFAKVPIKDILEQEKLFVRAEYAKEEAAEAEHAARVRGAYDLVRDDVIIEKAQEVKVIKAAFGNATRVLAMAGHLGESMVELSKQVSKALANPDEELEFWRAINLMKSYAWLNQQGMNLAQGALGMIRKEAGDPDETIKVISESDVRASSLEEERTLAAFGGDVDELRGAIRDVLDGTMSERAKRLVTLQMEAVSQQRH